MSVYFIGDWPVTNITNMAVRVRYLLMLMFLVKTAGSSDVPDRFCSSQARWERRQLSDSTTQHVFFPPISWLSPEKTYQYTVTDIISRHSSWPGRSQGKYWVISPCAVLYWAGLVWASTVSLDMLGRDTLRTSRHQSPGFLTDCMEWDRGYQSWRTCLSQLSAHYPD